MTPTANSMKQDLIAVIVHSVLVGAAIIASILMFIDENFKLAFLNLFMGILGIANVSVSVQKLLKNIDNLFEE